MDGWRDEGAESHWRQGRKNNQAAFLCLDSEEDFSTKASLFLWEKFLPEEEAGLFSLKLTLKTVAVTLKSDGFHLQSVVGVVLTLSC